MRINVWMLSLVLSLAIATTASAQRGRGGPGRGSGGMFGSRGLVSLAANEAVQKDLGVSADVVPKLEAINDDMRTEVREAMSGAGGGGNFRDMTAEEREKMGEKMAEIGKTMAAKYTPKVKELLTADQFTRLQQINWQQMGTSAYSDTEIVKTLTIAKDQQDKIKAITTEYDAKRRDLFSSGGRPEGGFEKMMEMNKERDVKINEVLTKDQLDKFAMLKGKEFDLEQLRGDRRRGDGGPGNANNGGGGNAAKGKRPQPKAE